MTEAPADGHGHQVGVGIRIIPAGVATVRGVLVVRASLVLSPIKASAAVAACGEPIDIRHWPRAIEEMLAGADAATLSANPSSNVTVGFSPVIGDGNAAKPVPGGIALSALRAMFHQQSHSPDFGSWKTQRGKDVSEIEALWSALVAPAGDRDWTALVDGLSNAGAIDRLATLRPPAPSTPAVNGALVAPKTSSEPDIRSVGRGQAALLLSLERGRSLLTRAQLLAKGQDCADRSDECNLAAAPKAASTQDDGKDAKQKDTARQDAESKGAAARAQAAWTLQKEVGKRLKDVTESALAGDRARRYADLLACLPQGGVAACLRKAAAPDTTALSKAVDESVDRHQDSVGPYGADAAGLNPVGAPPHQTKADFDKKQSDIGAQTRLRTLQSQPSLARLFNLVVDVLIPFEEFSALAVGAAPFVERRSLDGRSRFGFLSATFTCRGAERRVWTTSKVRLPEDGFDPDVWVCTRAELDLFAGLSGTPADRDVRDDLIAAGALPQIDGVVNLAARRVNVGEVEPRFDLTSLDVLQAVENRATTRLGSKAGVASLVTLRTAGLALIDRWRDRSALMQALASLDRENAPVAEQVVDAEDLTIGYRMDAAVEDGEALAWRSLCNRSIRFGDEDCRIEPLLGRAIPDRNDRLMYDGGLVVMPAKIVEQGTHSSAHVEDTVGIWTGPPVGVDANSQHVDLGENGAALQLGHVYSLGAGHNLETPPDWLIPDLIFGGGYHLGLTPRLNAGITRSLAKGRQYQGGRYARQDGAPVAAAERDFGILPTRATGPRRFLRHERIEAPLVATPEPILARKFDGIADGLRETAADVVVRSKCENGRYRAVDVAKGGAVKSSHRVVFPPSVPAIFVDRHGLFDGVRDKVGLTTYRGHGNKRWIGPHDGLRNVDYDQETGGFPVYGYAETSDGGIETAENSHVRPSGDAVFRPRSGAPTIRRDPYYPDPAASFLVVAVRDKVGRLLPGKPLVVPVRPLGVSFPDVRPIALEVRAVYERSGKPASQERILGLHMADGKLLRGADLIDNKRARLAIVEIDGGDAISGKGLGVPATRVDVALEPGEAVDIDVWCVPSVDELARWFDVIETAALIASLDQNGGTCQTCKGFEKRLDALDLGTLPKLVKRLSQSREDVDTKICALGTLAMPRGAVRCMAQIAFHTLLSRPTPEIAARVTISATHAIARPYAEPTLAIKLRRDSNETPLAPTPAAAVTPASAAASQQEARRSAAVSIAGTVSVDRPTTGFFEIRAEGASLVSNAFDDDARRRRTPDEFARGLWPRSPITGDRSEVSDVYGFKVDREGNVELPKETASLLRVDDDFPKAIPENAGMVARDLASLQAPTTAAALAALNGVGAIAPAPVSLAPVAQSPGNRIAIDRPFLVSDTRARVLTLTAVAGSRTAWCFRDTNGDPLTDAKASTVSKEQIVVLPAAKAPAKVVPLTVLPTFALPDARPTRNGSVVTVATERRVRLRIRMRRPWFSSGEGERLGIVLWPPDILKDRIAPSGSSVARDYDVQAGEKADISMQAFSDEDLGPGGPFVTRWGLDPIKGTQDKTSWLMPKSAFPDLSAAKVHAGTDTNYDVLSNEPLYVPRASVPIGVDDASGSKTLVRLEAALLTFVPRFDIDHESWFCDVELLPGASPEPFVRLGLVRYQPYAPTDLQVSEPIAEWVQIPQRRSVRVSIDETRPRVVSVAVCGTGRTHSDAPKTGYDPTRIESWTQRPIMKVSVLRRRADGLEDIARLAEGTKTDGGAAGFSQRAERVWAPRTQEEWTKALTMPEDADDARQRPQFAIQPDSPNESSEPLSWTATFALTDCPLNPQIAGSSYSVFIEEVEPMLPATYDDEPIDAAAVPTKGQVELVFSGPRFAARLDIPNR